MMWHLVVLKIIGNYLQNDFMIRCQLLWVIILFTVLRQSNHVSCFTSHVYVAFTTAWIHATLLHIITQMDCSRHAKQNEKACKKCQKKHGTCLSHLIYFQFSVFIDILIFINQWWCLWKTRGGDSWLRDHQW